MLKSNIPRLSKFKKSTRVSSGDQDARKKWKDVVFRYDGGADALDVYFTRVTPGLIDESDGPLDKVKEDVAFDLDKAGAIVRIEFLDASRCFGCHFLDTYCIVDNKPPLSLTCEYTAKSDELEVTFALDIRVSHREQFYDGVTVGRDAFGKIISLRFSRASSTICNTTRSGVDGDSPLSQLSLSPSSTTLPPSPSSTLLHTTSHFPLHQSTTQ